MQLKEEKGPAESKIDPAFPIDHPQIKLDFSDSAISVDFWIHWPRSPHCFEKNYRVPKLF